MVETPLKIGVSVKVYKYCCRCIFRTEFVIRAVVLTDLTLIIYGKGRYLKSIPSSPNVMFTLFLRNVIFFVKKALLLSIVLTLQKCSIQLLHFSFCFNLTRSRLELYKNLNGKSFLRESCFCGNCMSVLRLTSVRR